MISPRTSVIAGFVGVFLLGLVAGMGLERTRADRHMVDVFDAGPRARRHGVFLWSLERKLGLSQEQRSRIEVILARQDEELARATRPVEHETTEIRARSRREIRATLEPSQQARYDEIMRSWDISRGRATPAPSASF